MKKAAREMGFGDDWHAALETRQDPPRRAGQAAGLDPRPRAGGHRLPRRQRPRDDPAALPRLLAHDHDVARAAAGEPFFLGGETIIVSYPTSTMPHEAKMMSMRGNNIHFARATVHHELIPGHHLQGYMAPRYKNYRRAVQHAVLRRGLGALLGAPALGPRVRQVAREPGRHAVLADAPLRPDHLLARASTSRR